MTSLQMHAVKGNFVKEKPRVHVKRSTVQRYRHCDVLSFIAFEVAVQWYPGLVIIGKWQQETGSLFYFPYSLMVLERKASTQKI